jgi:hypothetical protein
MRQTAACATDCRRAPVSAHKLPPLRRRVHAARGRAGPAFRPPLPNPDQTSYTFGLTFGEQMHSVGITDQVSIDAVTRGLKDGLQGKKPTRPTAASCSLRALGDGGGCRRATRRPPRNSWRATARKKAW